MTEIVKNAIEKEGVIAIVRKLYGKDDIVERHRHRYEVNNTLIGQIEKSGMKVTGKSQDGTLVEIVELPEHPWFVGVQFHPEFTSTPRDSHPLFDGFVAAAQKFQKQRRDEGI